MAASPPIEPAITRDVFIAALEWQIAATVAQREDLVYTTPSDVYRIPMPAVAPTHVATAISHGCITRTRTETPLEKWGAVAWNSGVVPLLVMLTTHVLRSGASTYHVESVVNTTSHRQDTDWVDLIVRVVVPPCTTECDHLREQND